MVTFKRLTVEPKTDASGNEVAFLYNWDGKGKEGDDLYFDASTDGGRITFTVESDLCGTDSAVYKAVKALRVGDVILKKETIDLMTTDRLTDETRPTFWNNVYGYGLGVRCKSAILPDGGTDFGWGGAAGSLCVIDREYGFTIMLVQHMLSAPDATLRWNTIPFVRKAIS